VSTPAPITITPIHVGDLLADGALPPVSVQVVDHPDARVLVDTGMTELHPLDDDVDVRGVEVRLLVQRRDPGIHVGQPDRARERADASAEQVSDDADAGRGVSTERVETRANV
jgi:hypothetical protein